MVDFWPAVLPAAAAAVDDDDDDDADDGSRYTDAPAWCGLLGTLELFSKTGQQLTQVAQLSQRYRATAV